MANFVCDICGGAIKMQANRTGVCQGCGMEYDIEAIRAMAGQANNAVPTQTAPAVSAPAQAANDNELDRDALLIYLENVRTLETIIKESNSKSNRLSECIKEDDSALESYNKKIKEVQNKVQHKESFIDNPKTTSDYVGFIFFAFLTLFFALIGIPSYKEGGIVFLVGFGLPNLIVAVALGLRITILKKEYKQSLEKFDRDQKKELSTLNELKEICENRIANRRKEFSPIKSDLLIEINECEEILKQAYSANIIPMQFRTIEGVYYLYDYLSTSNQTLSEALMQANLEAIKQKLDQMIQLQSAQIIQQAQTNAQLAEIQDTNNRILATAQQTAKTAALAAKYAAISAVNSEVIKHLSSKQLAYQRADFWLK